MNQADMQKMYDEAQARLEVVVAKVKMNSPLGAFLAVQAPPPVKPPPITKGYYNHNATAGTTLEHHLGLPHRPRGKR